MKNFDVRKPETERLGFLTAWNPRPACRQAWRLVAGFLLVGVIVIAGCSPSKKAEEKKILFYRNPMNPAITSPVPKKDEMGMDYTPVYEAEKTGEKAAPGEIKISAEKQQLIGVKTEAARRSRLVKKIMTAGKIVSGSLYASVYEYELPLIKVGQRIVVSLPGQEITATIADIDSAVNPETRTATFRADVSGFASGLQPGQFVNVEIDVDMGTRLSVSRDAVMDSGTQQIVFVDKGNGYFEPRKVRVGLKTDSKVEILSGLVEGEKIVTSGNFLIDSESRLKSIIK